GLAESMVSAMPALATRKMADGTAVGVGVDGTAKAGVGAAGAGTTASAGSAMVALALDMASAWGSVMDCSATHSDLDTACSVIRLDLVTVTAIPGGDGVGLGLVTA